MERIRVRQTRSLFSFLFTAALLTGLWRVYDRRSRERIPGQEGIEDPEISAAFEWVSTTPQMHWLRHYVMSQAAVLQMAGKRPTWVAARDTWCWKWPGRPQACM